MRKVLVVTTACLLMTSCVIDKREMVSAVDQYNKEFVKLFGETDPNHTWSMVENKKVEVNLTKPSNVKVYVKAGKNYHLAADYQNVSGSQQLSFDAPMGCEDVYVTVDGVPYQSAGARTAIYENDQNVVSVYPENAGETIRYKVHKYSEISKFMGNSSVLPERKDNTGVVKKDFRVKSNGGTYRFYPLFWNADFEHTFGLYYYANDKRVEIDFYKDKKGDCLQYKNNTGQWENVEVDYVFRDILQGNIANDAEVLRSKIYEIKNIPADTEFGFYAHIYEKDGTERGTFYSDPSLNTPSNSFSSFSYLVRDGKTYITIEDNERDDFDYNDFIFIMEGTQTHIEETPVEYIYAVEDLGNTDDFDFNDVVFSVSHAKGQPHANVKLLAAGGTLPAYISFNGTSYGGEVHARFKDSAGNPIASNVMVNTAEGTNKANMKQTSPFVVPVPTNWSHAKHDFTTEGNGFGVMVQNEKNVTHVTPGNKPAPQILILPADWLWPTERTRINEAYTTFGTWCEKYINNTWTNTAVKELVVDWVGATQNNQ